MAQGVGEKAEHRIEMVFRIPWDDRSPDQPTNERKTGKADQRRHSQHGGAITPGRDLKPLFRGLGEALPRMMGAERAIGIA